LTDAGLGMSLPKRVGPYGPDDGTLSPWAAAASLPFAPEIVLPTLRHFDRAFPQMVSHYGFKCSFNPTFPARKTNGWISSGYYGLDQGPIVLMIENQRSELLWGLMRRCPSVGRGLRRAGFAGGWLGAAVPAHGGVSASGAGRRTRTPRLAMPRDLRGDEDGRT
jgi:hypothetical protein